MARLVAAYGSSHSIMLASRKEDWQYGFAEVDPKNPHYFDQQGEKTSYEALLAKAPAQAQEMVSPAKMAERFDATQSAMQALKRHIEAARLDVLLVIGDDQHELFQTSNNPAFAIYYGRSIRNAKREGGIAIPDPWLSSFASSSELTGLPELQADSIASPQPFAAQKPLASLKPLSDWYVRARLWRQEPSEDSHYPVHSEMAKWLIRQLSDRDFDITAMDGLMPGQYEGHAFSFIHRTYLRDINLPVIPVIVNTFDPPNQPTPRRCVQLGVALNQLIASYPEDLRVGVLASGGLSHFVVDEALDQGVIDSIRRKDLAWLAALKPKHLQAGSSEIRNWIIGIAAAQSLDLEWAHYIPGYRSPALSGTGLCFAAWKTLD